MSGSCSGRMRSLPHSAEEKEEQDLQLSGELE